MPRTARKISCTKSDIQQLQILSNDASHARLAKKASMILMCIEGKRIKDIAAELGERPNTVILWRDRFIDKGIAGLGNLPRGIGKVIYGEPFKKRLLSKLDEKPPDGMKQWSGHALSEALQVPEDTVWRYLRKSGIHLRNLNKQESKENQNFEVEVPVVLIIKGEDKVMKKGKAAEKAKSDIEIIARIKNPDGTIIERKVEMKDAVPQIDDFDFSTREGFLNDFDVYEKAMVKARDQMTNEITQAYVNSGVKKTKK